MLKARRVLIFFTTVSLMGMSNLSTYSYLSLDSFNLFFLPPDNSRCPAEPVRCDAISLSRKDGSHAYFENLRMCFRLLLILIFPALFSSAQTFLLCRDQDGISFGLNGKTAEKGVCASSSERAEPRSEIRSLVCHPADVLPLRWEREGEGTRVSMYVCVCMRISREKTIKGL